MMGELICACELAGIVGCSLCRFADKHRPLKMYHAPWDSGIEKGKCHPESLEDFENMADEIIATLDGGGVFELGIINQEEET